MKQLWSLIHWMGRICAHPIFFISANAAFVIVLLWDHFGPQNLRLTDESFNVIVSLFTLFIDMVIIIVSFQFSRKSAAAYKTDHALLLAINRKLDNLIGTD